MVSGVGRPAALPEGYALGQNYPNPFNPATRIGVTVPSRSHVIVKVYDVFGRETDVLMDGTKAPGTYSLTWNASGRPSGVYFCRMISSGFTRTIRMILVK